MPDAYNAATDDDRLGDWTRVLDTGANNNQQLSEELPTKYDDFITTHLPHANKIATEYGVDPALVLGVSAYESAWGTSRMARELNNPFGATPDSRTGTNYSSPDSAWNNWGEQWGPRIRGVGSDKEGFIDQAAGRKRWS